MTPDQILLDVWGVLHDGRTVYDDGRRFLARMARAGVQVDLVTNASYSRAMLVADLDARGLDRTGIASIWTAGEVARHSLVNHNPASVYFEGLPHSRWLVEGFDEAPIERAEMVVFAHPRPTSRAVLAVARQRDLHVLCANPDAFIEDRAGVRTEQAGALAGEHESLGGRLERAGKPDSRIFQLARVGAFPLMVGDNPATDLAGAVNAELASAWVMRRERTDQAAVTARYRPLWTVRTLDALLP